MSSLEELQEGLLNPANPVKASEWEEHNEVDAFGMPFFFRRRFIAHPIIDDGFQWRPISTSYEYENPKLWEAYQEWAEKISKVKIEYVEWLDTNFYMGSN